MVLYWNHGSIQQYTISAHCKPHLVWYCYWANIAAVKCTECVRESSVLSPALSVCSLYESRKFTEHFCWKPQKVLSVSFTTIFKSLTLNDDSTDHSHTKTKFAYDFVLMRFVVVSVYLPFDQIFNSHSFLQ